MGERVRTAVTALPPAQQAALGAALDVLVAAFHDSRAHLVAGS